MLTRKDLRPGMKLQNTASGAIGLVRGDPNSKDPARLMRAHLDYVRVRVVGSRGKYQYPTWWLRHIKIR